MLQKLILTTLLVLTISNIYAQLILLETGISYTINFEESLEGVNEGPFLGMGITSSPQAGQLNSNAWEVLGCSDGDALFGGDYSSGDFSRGHSLGSETSGGLYDFETYPYNHSLGWQSTGSDLSPGSISLKVKNQSGFSIERLSISYTLFLLNDQNRSQSIDLYYSYDNLIYHPIPAASWTSPLFADPSPAFRDSLFNITLDLNPILNEDDFYLKWTISDNGGSGSRDEWALDDISIQISNNTCLNEIFTLSDSLLNLESSAGFVLNGVDSYYTSPSNYGSHSPSARFDDHLDNLVSPLLSSVFSLKFWIKALGNSDGSSLLIEGFDGSSWSQLDNITPLPSTGTSYSLQNLSTYSQFRFTYLKVSGNLAIDDIQFSCGTCLPDDEVLLALNELNVLATHCNQVSLNWDSIDADYYLVLATEKPAVNNNPQDQNTYSADSNYGAGELFEDSVYVVYNGSLTTFTLQQLEAGKTYFIKVIPYNGLNCEENYSSMTISGLVTMADCSQCPYLEWAMINACNEDCGNEEGKNEMLLINSGEYSFTPDTNDFKVQIINANSSILNQEIVAAPLLVNYLNSICSTLFIDGSQLPSIPSNIKVLICNADLCFNEFPDEILCLYPVVYILACQSSEWNSLGVFKNQGYLDQIIQLDFQNVDSNCVTNYQYRPDDLPNQDATMAQFGQFGGAMTSFESSDHCFTSSNPLPLEWGELKADVLASGVELKWFTYSEFDNDAFEIESSKDGSYFTEIASVASLGNSSYQQFYEFTDPINDSGKIYYRIKQVDLYGSYSYSETIVVELPYKIQLKQLGNKLIISGLKKDIYSLSIYSIEGRRVLNSQFKASGAVSFNLSEVPAGLYIIQILNNKNTFTMKYFWKN